MCKHLPQWQRLYSPAQVCWGFSGPSSWITGNPQVTPLSHCGPLKIAPLKQSCIVKCSALVRKVRWDLTPRCWVSRGETTTDPAATFGLWLYDQTGDEIILRPPAVKQTPAKAEDSLNETLGLSPVRPSRPCFPLLFHLDTCANVCVVPRLRPCIHVCHRVRTFVFASLLPLPDRAPCQNKRRGLAESDTSTICLRCMTRVCVCVQSCVFVSLFACACVRPDMVSWV